MDINKLTADLCDAEIRPVEYLNNKFYWLNNDGTTSYWDYKDPRCTVLIEAARS